VAAWQLPGRTICDGTTIEIDCIGDPERVARLAALVLGDPRGGGAPS
jgi:hypothetical protein